MKIARARARLIDKPGDHPLVVGLPPDGSRRQFVTLEMETDDGIEGIGITFFGGALSKALKSAGESLAEMTIGEDPMRTDAIVNKLRPAVVGAGPGGLATLAMSAVDIALWDIKGKALGQSVNAMLGGLRASAPTYASGALLRQHPTDYLAKAGPRFVEMGFRQMKTQLGSERTVSEAIERIRVMRESIGPDIDLMCDINQLWNVNQAIEIGSQLEPYHLFWLEDVTVCDDYQGLARVADALTTPIAAGEYVFGISPFRQLIENRSIDIVMIDLVRVGGITQWLKVAGMAEAFNLPVVSHLFPEIHVQLITAIPNGLTVEYFPMTHGMFENPPEIKDGQIHVPEGAGLGLRFDQAYLSKYEVA
jgi:L-alanine-DL-glutamate epimerase-like enolase superfamily enzyme